MIADFKAIPFKSFNNWFSELAEIAAKSDDSSSLPKLELLLKAGNIIRGHILKVQKDDQEQMLMIAGLSDAYSKSELTIISGSQVIGLTLLEPDSYLKEFVLPAVSKSIGSLELKRAAKSVGEKVESLSSGKVTFNVAVENFPESSRWEMLQVIEMLPELLEKLTQDELGSKMFYEAVSTIEVAVAQQANTSLVDKNLKVEIASPINSPMATEKDRIKNDIEGLL